MVLPRSSPFSEPGLEAWKLPLPFGALPIRVQAEHLHGRSWFPPFSLRPPRRILNLWPEGKPLPLTVSGSKLQRLWGTTTARQNVDSTRTKQSHALHSRPTPPERWRDDSPIDGGSIPRVGAQERPA